MHYIRPQNIKVKRKGIQRGTPVREFGPRLNADPPEVYAKKIEQLDWSDYTTQREEREKQAELERKRRVQDRERRWNAIDWSR